MAIITEMELLQGQRVMLEFLSRTLLESPDKHWLQSLVDQNTFDEVPYAAQQQDVQEGLSRLQAWQKEFSNDTDETTIDFMRLFIGPCRPLAPPWESTFIGNENLLFQKNTLKVRAWYRQYGLESKHLHQEPDDHIALELEFIAQLTGLAVHALQEKEGDRSQCLLVARCEFLNQHLLKWCFDWCLLVSNNARGEFYQGISKLISGIMKELRESYNLIAQ